jgi:DNA-binding LytR/AlgR family response regulator
MTPLLALVAEDEAPQREALCRLLRELWPQLAAVVACADGIAALDVIAENPPAVAFLDIRMPGVGGLEVARAVAERGGLVVFTTAYDAHAVAAFEAGAVDYLLKPVRSERLAHAITRLRERLAARQRPPLTDVLDKLAQQLPVPAAQRIRWITAAVGDQVRLIGLDEIIYFQAEGKYVRVATAGEDALIRLSLKELIAGLDPEQFWQVHRSVVVRVAAIDRLRKDELGKFWLSLRGRTDRVPASPAFQRKLRGM